MDRLIHIALNTIKYAQEDSTIRANNLANISVPGYRRDIEPKNVDTSFVMPDQELRSRAFAMREGKNRFSNEDGQIEHTQRETDIAIVGEGYFVIEPDNGEPALSRRGDFRVSQDGFLVDGTGAKVLNEQMQPVLLPPYRELVFGDHGQITIEPIDGEPGQREEIGFVATAKVETGDLQKYSDGHIRRRDGGPLVPDLQADIKQGYLEKSNVNTVEELVRTLHRQRHYELNIKLLSVAREIDESGSSVMRLPR
jgi:flagellar basal-body rod protein FlgF